MRTFKNLDVQGAFGRGTAVRYKSERSRRVFTERFSSKRGSLSHGLPTTVKTKDPSQIKRNIQLIQTESPI